MAGHNFTSKRPINVREQFQSLADWAWSHPIRMFTLVMFVLDAVLLFAYVQHASWEQ